MGSLNLFASGMWRKAKAAHVFASGSWHKAKAVWLFTQGAWKKISFGFNGVLVSARHVSSTGTFIGKPSVVGVGSFTGEGDINGQVPSVSAIGFQRLNDGTTQAVATVLNLSPPFSVDFSYGGITRTFTFTGPYNPVPCTVDDYNWLQSLVNVPVDVSIYK